MPRFVDYIYIASTIAFTVYGQLVIKWRVLQFDPMPASGIDKLKHFTILITDPFIFSGLIAAFLASLAWISAMSKFELSYAYPFMSLNFVIVLILSTIILSEPLNLYKIIGVTCIILGTLIAAKG